MDYKQKYIKYKNKYLDLKKLIGGFTPSKICKNEEVGTIGTNICECEGINKQDTLENKKSYCRICCEYMYGRGDKRTQCKTNCEDKFKYLNN